MDTHESPALDRILQGFRSEGDIHLISGQSRAFGGMEGSEEAYARQFPIGDDYVLAEKRGLVRMIETVGGDRGGPALEIGCGTGIFSRALVNSGLYPEYLITDASIDFVRLARAFVSHPFPEPPVQDPSARTRYGLLLEDGLALLPQGEFSMVSLRYVLHHILDWDAFIGTCARLLRPGGVLTFEEPCIEGYVLQASLLQSLSKQLGPNPRSVPRRIVDRLVPGRYAKAVRAVHLREQIRQFVEVIEFYCRTDLEKGHAEDKHLFRPAEVIRAGRKHGLEVEFFANSGFDTLATAPRDFAFEFFHNLRANFGFGEPIVDAVKEHLRPQLELIARLDTGGAQPVCKGLFACRRVA